MPGKRSGFTLVELLVVIGIIALLISILLPALSKVRHQASIAKCAAQMRDMIASVQIYCNSNRGWFPPYHLDVGTPKASLEVMGGLWKNDTGVNMVYTHFYYGGSSLANVNDPGALLGRLYKTRDIKSDKVLQKPGLLQCPNVKTSENDYLSNNYFNPHLAARTNAAISGGYYVVPWWPKIDNYGKGNGGPRTVWKAGTITTVSMPSFRAALLTDPIWDLANSTHSRGNFRAWNLAYADGSVRTYTGDQFVSRATGKWQRLLDISNAIQHAADGGSVVWRSGSWPNSVYNVLPIDP